MDRDQQQQPDHQPAKPKARKRFQLEKLEERIAPAAHYNPHTQLVGTGNGGQPYSSQGTTDTGWSYSGQQQY